MGAWPTTASIDHFEVDSGRHLDVVNLFVDWNTPFSQIEPSLQTVAENNSEAMITWMPNGLCDSQIVGAYNQALPAYIKSFADGIKAFAHPVLIRPMHEMNGDWYSWAIGYPGCSNTNQDYIKAWDHIVTIFRQEGTTNAQFVWSVNNTDIGIGTSFTCAYPGDSVVDYIGIDGYNFGGLTWSSFKDIFSQAYNAIDNDTSSSQCDAMTISRSKPILITEWASAEKGGNKAKWITDAFNQVEAGTFPRIKGLFWFNEKKERDWRIESSQSAQQAYYASVHSPTPWVVDPEGQGILQLAGGQEGIPYLQTILVTGGQQPYTWVVTNSALPAGLTLTSSPSDSYLGLVGGIPTTGGNFKFSIQVADSSRPQWAVTATFTINIPPQWHIISNSSAGVLSGVATISANDIWAVGSADNQALIEHWDGTRWRVVKSPPLPGTTGDYLAKVAAVSANDIWAVGYDGNGNGLPQTLIEHWDGSRWSVVKSLDVGAGGNQLYAVAAVSANDVWAVGADGSSRALIEQWNGTEWNVVASPNMNGNAFLSGVAAVSANDIWAVGYDEAGQTLIEQWNGAEWSIVPNPEVNGGLSGVTAVSANDVWVVGSEVSTDGNEQALIEQWDGTKWSIVPCPSPGVYGNELYSVAAASANDIWAVGWYNSNSSTSVQMPGQALIERWDGTRWEAVTSPNPGTSSDLLAQVAIVPGTYTVWAVGSNNNTLSPLIEWYD